MGLEGYIREGWGLRLGTWQRLNRGFRQGDELPAHIGPCGIKESIEAPLRSLEDQLCGLDISTFKA